MGGAGWEVGVGVDDGEVGVDVDHLRRSSPGLLQPLLGLSRRYEVPTKQLVVDLRVIRMDC